MGGFGKLYKLENGEVSIVKDHDEWAKWFNNASRSVAYKKEGGTEVSTVFLGIDHNHSGEGEPVLFETMVFGGQGDQEICYRYCTIEEAKAGHEKVCNEVFNDED